MIKLNLLDFPNSSEIREETHMEIQPNMVESSEELWRFYMDILLTLALALCSFLANIGLLCLARLTRPASQANNSSFSANFGTTNNVSSTNNCTNTNGSSNNNNSNTIFAFNPLYSPRRSVPNRRSNGLDFGQANCEFDRLESNTTLYLKKCVSSVSLLRSSLALNASQAFASPSPCRTRRSRRQQRYLRGLFGLSISNLTLSFSLLTYSICNILLRHESYNQYRSIHWIEWFSLCLADMAQSFELGAVLWIALERTLGIHWPAEKRASSSRTEIKSAFKSALLTRLCRNWHCCCDKPLETQSHINHDMMNGSASMISLTKTQTTVLGAFSKSHYRVHCFPSLSCLCKRDGDDDDRHRHHRSYHRRTLSKTNRKNLSQFIRFSLCILPSVLFLMALVHKLSLVWIATDHLTNQTKPVPCRPTQVELSDRGQLGRPAPYAWFQVDLSSNQTTSPVYYYTDEIVSALVIGQFLAPLAILVTTNLLIYRKVAARDKRFFSRQSSNTSKSSFLSTTSSITTATNLAASRKTTNATIAFPIPLLRVLESSNQDIRIEETIDPKKTTPDMKLDALQSNSTTKQIDSLLVPPIGTSSHSYNEPFIRRPSPERRNSTSVIGSPNLSLSCILDYEQSSGIGDPTSLPSKSSLLVSPQQRRKSTNDIFSALFQSKSQDVNATLQKSNEEPLLLQVLRRQHRRTLRILIILLLVFVMCRAPRSIVLLIQWLMNPSPGPNPCSPYLNHWLQYTSLWAYTSAILDTIVYGFWGNRAYRVHLRHWYARCSMCTRCK